MLSAVGYVFCTTHLHRLYPLSTMDTRVFISYRRDDSSYPAAALHHYLANRLGSGNVFFDVDSIPYGVDFAKHIDAALVECTCVAAVIGPGWASRMHDPSDFVRQEMESALRLTLPILPVFVGTQRAVPDGIPESITQLKGFNGRVLRPGIADQARDLEAIHMALVNLVAAQAVQCAPAPSATMLFDRSAQQDAGELYYTARERYDSRDYDEAIRYFKLAAQKGDARACQWLSEIYSDGEIRDPDPKETVRWALVGAQLGDKEMQNYAGICYVTGIGVDVDFEQARHWLRLAANQGDKDAKKWLDDLKSPLFRLQLKAMDRFKLSEKAFKRGF
jgi:hypothetical protein